MHPGGVKCRENKKPLVVVQGEVRCACRITFKFYLEIGNLGDLILRIALINLPIDRWAI